MKPLRIPLKAVLYKEEGAWIAHCLEFDLVGDGDSKEEALRSLSEAITVQVVASIKYNNPANLFKPAEGRYFRMFAAGTDTATGELALLPKIDSVTIEDVEARDYIDQSDSDADLMVTA